MPQDPGAVAVRRAPFSENPRVGARGQRTQQGILDAALQGFAEQGYHGCSIERIMELASCSRVAFYQYFANKEDVFAHLAGQVARQVSASTETLAPVTADQGGWDALRVWIGRYAEIHARYEPVFHAYESDATLAALAGETGEETVARIRARVGPTSFAPRQLDVVIRLLLEVVNHTLDVGAMLRSVEGGAPSDSVEQALTDVVHRTLFGLQAGVNAHAPTAPAPPTLRFTAELFDLFQPDEFEGTNGTRGALLAAGREVFNARGYHNTRVDDVIAAAGVSRGAFYRYFKNKDQLARTLTARAVRAVGASVTEVPDASEGRAALRRWLVSYHAAHTREAAMLQVRVEAALQDPALRSESAPLLDWGRRRFARYLEGRDFGDPEVESIVIVALLGIFGARARPNAEIDAAVQIIERGLLGAAA